jgi:hypothetical protein
VAGFAVHTSQKVFIALGLVFVSTSARSE